MTPVAEEPAELYALSAVLMDGESGRVLYEKDGERPLANASTTKVLTCIVALENSPGGDYVQVSQSGIPAGSKAGTSERRTVLSGGSSVLPLC